MKDESRSEKLLALLLLQQMKGATQVEKTIQLSLAGFSNIEIADFLQTTTATVSQNLYASKKSKKKAPAAKKRTPNKSS